MENKTEPKKKSRTGVVIGVIVVLVLLFFFVFGFITIQPIGAIPNGVTLLVIRVGTQIHFFDSPDAMCMRTSGGVSLLCRMAALSAVAENSSIVLRMPYSEAFYLASTGGVTFDK